MTGVKRYLPAVVAALVAIAAIGGVVLIVTSDKGCAGLSDQPVDGEKVVRNVVAIDVGGNTEAWSEGVADFVKSSLVASLPEDPRVQLEAKVVLVQDGVVVPIDDSCASDWRVLRAGAEDLDDYKDATDSTKREIEASVQTRREKLVAKIADATAGTVEQLSFDQFSSDNPPSSSPVALFVSANAAAEKRDSGVEANWVSVYGPMFSNASDCLEPTDKAAPAAELVGDCVEFKALPVPPKDTRLVVDYPDFLATGRGQQEAADEMRDALCTMSGSNQCA